MAGHIEDWLNQHLIVSASIGLLACIAGIGACIATFVVAYLLPGLALGLLLASGCEETVGPTIASPGPDYRYAAQVRTRNCGAISGWNTRVILSEQPDFRIDERPMHTEIQIGNIHPEHVLLEWSASSTLRITNVNPYAKPAAERQIDWLDAEVVITVEPGPLKPAPTLSPAAGEDSDHPSP
jgi:hypothetical protein